MKVKIICRNPAGEVTLLAEGLSYKTALMRLASAYNQMQLSAAGPTYLSMNQNGILEHLLGRFCNSIEIQGQ